jgi:DNA-binding NarL/FixJ family response regulator
MATEPSHGASNQFSEYEKLAAEYRACEISCQASLDQLRAAERELRIEASKHDGDVDTSVPDEIESALRQNVDRNRSVNADAIANLSHRERNVLELIGQGLLTSAIAKRLNIASSTVETYRERLKKKLKLETGFALTRYAILWLASRDMARSVDADGRDGR